MQVVFGLIVVAAMITHIVHCVAVNWSAMLIIGLLVFPVGVIHGVGLWFGLW